MISPNIIINVNDKNRQIRMGYSNPDRKDKTSSKNATTSYINDMIDYYSNPEKAPITYRAFLDNEVQPNSEYANMVIGYDYKNKKALFAKVKDLDKIKKQNEKYIEHSNVNQLVISFQNNFINENITVEKLYDEMAKNVLPKFFEKLGYDPKKISYQLSFHTDTDNFHFHLGFMEKEAAYKSRWKKEFQYRRKLNIDQELLNDLKKSIQLRVEKEKKFNPLVKNIDEQLSLIKNELKDKEKNYILSNAKHLRIEEKILRLGKLLDEERKKNSKSNMYKIKFGSITDPEIKKLTNEIKKSLFSNTSQNQDLVLSFNESVDNLKKYLKKVNDDNLVKAKEEDFKIAEKKEEELNSFIMNQIVNSSLYEYKRTFFEISKIKQKNYFIQELCYQNYKNAKYKTKMELLQNYIDKSKKEDILNNYSMYEDAYMPNLKGIKFKLEQMSRKRDHEVRKIKEQQNQNWYDRSKY